MGKSMIGMNFVSVAESFSEIEEPFLFEEQAFSSSSDSLLSNSSELSSDALLSLSYEMSSDSDDLPCVCNDRINDVFASLDAEFENRAPCYNTCYEGLVHAEYSVYDKFLETTYCPNENQLNSMLSTFEPKPLVSLVSTSLNTNNNNNNNNNSNAINSSINSSNCVDESNYNSTQPSKVRFFVVYHLVEQIGKETTSI